VIRNRYQLLSAATVVAILVLIAVGSLVRTTGSGLGCPDWPQCHGAWIPPFERTAIIEYSHRSTAAIVSVLVIALAITTYVSRRGDRALVWLSTSAVALLFFQAYLGKVTVEHELPPAVVTSHLATALALLAVVCAITALSVLGEGREVIRTRQRAALMQILVIASVVTYAVLLWGAYVVKADATTACISWPGCSAAPIPFVDNGPTQAIHWIHRLSVLLGAGVIGWVAMALRREAPSLRTAGRLLMWLYLAQILVGASNIWTNFSSAARIAHLALAATIWAVLVLTLVAARYRGAGATRGAGDDGSGVRGGQQSAHV
jgi:heme A synthase